MAPHAEDGPVGVAANGHEEVVNDGQAPLEPGVKKTIAQGKMMAFPRLELYLSNFRAGIT